jgi:triacylglycerol lipase
MTDRAPTIDPQTSKTAGGFPRPRARPAALPTLLRETLSTRDAQRWPAPPPGDGRPAMLVPGFLAGDPSLARMVRWLRGGGWQTIRPAIRLNVDCMEPAVERLEQRLEAAVVAREGRRTLVIGQSRGGLYGWALAVRRPDLVETLVTLGSPSSTR